MAMPAKDIREWLESFEKGDLIAIDEGGLALVGLTLSGAPRLRPTSKWVESQPRRTASND